MSSSFPLRPKAPGGKQKGKRAHVPRWRGPRHGYGRGSRGGRRGYEGLEGCGGGQWRMQMCGAVERRGTMGGNTRSYCLERKDRNGATREAAEDYSPQTYRTPVRHSQLVTWSGKVTMLFRKGCSLCWGDITCKHRTMERLKATEGRGIILLVNVSTTEFNRVEMQIILINENATHKFHDSQTVVQWPLEVLLLSFMVIGRKF